MPNSHKYFPMNRMHGYLPLSLEFDATLSVEAKCYIKIFFSSSYTKNQMSPCIKKFVQVSNLEVIFFCLQNINIPPVLTLIFIVLYVQKLLFAVFSRCLR